MSTRVQKKPLNLGYKLAFKKDGSNWPLQDKSISILHCHILPSIDQNPIIKMYEKYEICIHSRFFFPSVNIL